MRAREFTQPITSKDYKQSTDDETINPFTDSTPEEGEAVKSDKKRAKTASLMVPPLQQDIELKKAILGKDSDTIDDLTADQLQKEPTR